MIRAIHFEVETGHVRLDLTDGRSIIAHSPSFDLDMKNETQRAGKFPLPANVSLQFYVPDWSELTHNRDEIAGEA